MTTPGAPGYDAVRLVKVRNHSIGDVFELEPRDSTFAVARERDLIAAASDAVNALAVVDAVHDVKAECRTATCELTLTTDAARMDELSASVGLFPFSNAVTPRRRGDPADPNRGFVTFLLAYAPENVSHATFRNWYADLLTKKGLTRELSMAGVPSGEWWKGDEQ